MRQILWIMAFCLLLFNACRPTDETGTVQPQPDYSVDNTITEDMKNLTDISIRIMKTAAPKPHFMTWENFKNTFSNLHPKDRS